MLNAGCAHMLKLVKGSTIQPIFYCHRLSGVNIGRRAKSAKGLPRACRPDSLVGGTSRVLDGWTKVM